MIQTMQINHGQNDWSHLPKNVPSFAPTARLQAPSFAPSHVVPPSIYAQSRAAPIQAPTYGPSAFPSARALPAQACAMAAPAFAPAQATYSQAPRFSPSQVAASRARTRAPGYAYPSPSRAKSRAAKPKYSFHGGILPRGILGSGYIIRVVHCELAFEGAEYNDSDLVKTPGGDYCIKHRILIIVACYDDHFIALPLFTNSGNGLGKKRAKDEWVSLRDHRSQGAFEKLSIHDPIVTKELYDRVPLYRTNTVCHLAYPVARKFDHPATMEGRLDERSTKHLVELYLSHAKQAQAQLAQAPLSKTEDEKQGYVNFQPSHQAAT